MSVLNNLLRGSNHVSHKHKHFDFEWSRWQTKIDCYTDPHITHYTQNGETEYRTAILYSEMDRPLRVMTE